MKEPEKEGCQSLVIVLFFFFGILSFADSCIGKNNTENSLDCLRALCWWAMAYLIKKL